jgi:rhomboid protease GluP
MSVLQEVRQSPVSAALFAANVVMYAWMCARGSDWLEPTGVDVLAYGANAGIEVAQGEWWRLATSMFLHSGALHLFLNMWSLRVLGPFVEQLFGRGTYFVLYMLAGIGGSIASCLWNPLGLSVGASGAIFGLLGAIIAFFLTHRRSMPAQVFRSYMQRMGLLLAINLYLGFSIPRIDNAGHLGGLVAGFVCGLAAFRPAGTRPVLDARRIVRLAVVAVVLAGVGFLVPARVEKAWIEDQQKDASEDSRPR